MGESEENGIGNVITLLGETSHDTVVAFGEDAYQVLDLGDLGVGELRFWGECQYKTVTIESKSWRDALSFAVAEFDGREHPVASAEECDELLKGKL